MATSTRRQYKRSKGAEREGGEGRREGGEGREGGGEGREGGVCLCLVPILSVEY